MPIKMHSNDIAKAFPRIILFPRKVVWFDFNREVRINKKNINYY